MLLLCYPVGNVVMQFLECIVNLHGAFVMVATGRRFARSRRAVTGRIVRCLLFELLHALLECRVSKVNDAL